MSDWKLAMLAILPLMAGWHSIDWRHRLGSARMRTWAAMFGASIAASVLFPWLIAQLGPFPAEMQIRLMVGSFIAIDTAAALIVLAHPSGFAQKAIGFLFAAMVLFHGGFLFAAAEPRFVPIYMDRQEVLGWVQFTFLLGWGAHNALGLAVDRRFDRLWPVHPSPRDG